MRRGVAALIVAPFGDDETARASLPDGIPVVVIDRRCGIDDKDVVRVTDHEGALEAVRHLIAHGHTRIAFLGETAEFTTVQDRLAGYTDALVGAGLTVDPELVETRCWNEEASYPLALAMLAPADAPTAVFATTPLVGLGVLRALKRLDRQDTAVVVFGDFPLAGLMTPPTTVVDQRPTALAHAAFDHLERRLDDPHAPGGRDRPAHPPDPARVRRAAAPEGLLVRHPLVVDLGFDLGTTVTKLTALAEDGTKLLDLSVATTWDELGDGCAERDPRAVVAAVEDLLARAAATVGTTNGHGPLEIRSIGFASMAESGVLVDADGEPRSPVIAWFDPRGRDQVAALSPELAHDFPARTGLPVTHVASMFKIAWLRDQGLVARRHPVALAARAGRSRTSGAAGSPSSR